MALKMVSATSTSFTLVAPCPAAEDWFDNYVASEFMEIFEGFIYALRCQRAGDRDAYVFKQGKNVVFVYAVLNRCRRVNHVEAFALHLVEHVHAEHQLLKAEPRPMGRIIRASRSSSMLVSATLK